MGRCGECEGCSNTVCSKCHHCQNSQGCAFLPCINYHQRTIDELQDDAEKTPKTHTHLECRYIRLYGERVLMSNLSEATKSRKVCLDETSLSEFDQTTLNERSCHSMASETQSTVTIESEDCTVDVCDVCTECSHPGCVLCAGCQSPGNRYVKKVSTRHVNRID